MIANGENAAAGFGITRETSATSCSSWGVDVMTSGNHIWDKKEALDYIARRAAPAAAGQLPGRRARRRLAIVAQTARRRARSA